MPVISTTWEAKAGESLEHGKQRLQSETSSQKKKVYNNLTLDTPSEKEAALEAPLPLYAEETLGTLLPPAPEGEKS